MLDSLRDGWVGIGHGLGNVILGGPGKEVSVYHGVPCCLIGLKRIVLKV